jgi:hypothetical protein
MSSLIQSSGILNQLWCGTCGHLSNKQPTARLGPMYLVRYRVPSLIGGPTRWVEQHAYPFAHPRPVTFVAPGQPFWHQRTAGGWYEAGPLLRTTLVHIGVPSTTIPGAPAVDPVSLAPGSTQLIVALASIAVAAAVIFGLVLVGRTWARARAASHTHPA